MLKSIKFSDFIFGVFIFALLFFLQVYNGRASSDNGVFLAGAWGLINHLEIYQDFFSFTSPGTYYSILAVWKIFGLSYWVAWGTALLFLFISATLVFKIALRFNRFSAYLATLMFCLISTGWPIISSHIFCLPFILAAVYLVIIGLEKRRPKFIYLAGFLIGVSVIFLQTIGLAAMAAIAVFLLGVYFQNKDSLNLKNLLIFSLFFCLPIISLFLKWSPSYLFTNLIYFPLFNYSKTLQLNYWLLILNFLFLIIFFLILRKNHRQSLLIKLLVILQLFLFLAATPFPDFVHLAFVFAPLLILFSVSVSQLLEVRSMSNFLGISVATSFFSLFFAFYFMVAICFFSFPWFTPSDEILELFVFSKENCQTDYIYAGPFLPEFYFESRKLTPGPSHWLLTNHHPEEYFSKTLKKLEATKPDCAIVNYQMVAGLNYDRNNLVDNYLLSNYQVVKQWGDTQILKRKP